MNYNYFFWLVELRKKFHYLMLSNGQNRKGVGDVSSCLTKTFHGYEVIRYEKRIKERNIFYSIVTTFDLARHHKYKVSCYFIIDESLP